MLKNLFGGLLALTLSGCALFPTPVDTVPPPLYNAKGEMTFVIGGKKFEGMTAVKLEGPFSFQGISKSDIDQLLVTTCNRSISIPFSGRAFTYTFNPLDIEKECMSGVYIQALQKKGAKGNQGVTDWGFIAFRSFEDLKAHVECNGEGWTYEGFSTCEAKVGSIQRIEFEVPITHFRAGESCHIERKSDRIFDVRLDLGECTMAFTDGTHKHSSIFIGYGRELMR